MKARAASPDVLVDLNRLERAARDHGRGETLQLGAMATYTQIMGSSEVEVSRPILAEVAAQIADVQVRNRGTIGGNVCSNDPTNHLPPLLVALGASMTIRGAGRRAHGAGRGVLPRRLHDRRRRGRAAASRSPCPLPPSAADGFAVGHDRPRRHLHRQRRREPLRQADRRGSRSAASTPCRCCVDARADRRGEHPQGRRRAPRSIRRRTSTPRPTTGATSRRSAPCAPSQQAAERRTVSMEAPSIEPHDLGRGQRRASTSARSRRAGCSSTSSATTST